MDLAEAAGQALVILEVQGLVSEEQDMVARQGRAEFLSLSRGDRGRQIDAGDFRAHVRGQSRGLDRLELRFGHGRVRRALL